jgi:glycosyltransferase involved in cell wall biosynthesis
MVATIYDVAPLAMSHLLSLPKRMYARAMFAYVRRRASALLTISEFTRAEFLRLVGVPRGTISVIPLAAGDEWRGISAGPRPDPAPYLVYVGNVKPQKNLVALLSAFASLLDRIPHRLVIVGRERGFITGDPRVQQMARQLGDRVLLTGEVDDETLRGWVAHADALVFPSLYEGFGLPPLEAMAIGTPAVVSHAASLPEVCGDAALYFDPHDPSDIARQIECVVGNHAIADRLRRAGRQRVSQSSWSDCAARTTAVLQAVLRGGVR